MLKYKNLTQKITKMFFNVNNKANISGTELAQAYIRF